MRNKYVANYLLNRDGNNYFYDVFQIVCVIQKFVYFIFNYFKDISFMRTIFASLFLLIISCNNISANCIASYNKNGIKIGVVGDSFFTTNPNSCNSFESLLKKKFDTNNVQNAAVGGSTVLGFGNKAIRNQDLDFTPDIFILGGGGNDFQKCGNDFSCLSQKLNSFISKDLNDGHFKKVINKHIKNNTKVFIIYTSIVAEHAPKSWKKLVKVGLGEMYSRRMQNFSSKSKNIYWIDAGKILSPYEKKHWLNDGFHPSSEAYELIINAIRDEF